MAQLMVLLVGIAVVFSAIAFNGGNPLVGVLFALLAAAPFVYLGYLIVQRRRPGGTAPGAPRPQQQPMRTLVLRITAMAVVAAIGYGVYWVMFTPKANDEALTRVSDFESGCGSGAGRRYFPQAAELSQGGGPHPIAMFNITASGSPSPVSPASGMADYWSGFKLDPHQVQLIACLETPDDGEFLTDCKFTSDTLKLYRGVYDVTVYEARTGKEVGSEQVLGSAKPSCPGLAYLKDGADTLHTDPEVTDYQAVLRKYVGG